MLVGDGTCDIDDVSLNAPPFTAASAPVKMTAASRKYMQRTNEELAKLAALGVSVFVSSGDDGLVGFSGLAPLDPKRPLTLFEEDPCDPAATAGMPSVVQCPFESCACASLMVYRERDNMMCLIPSGLVMSR